MDLTPDQIFAIKAVEDAAKAAIAKIRKEWYWKGVDEMKIYFHFTPTEISLNERSYFRGQDGIKHPIAVSYPDMVSLFRKRNG
jgi:hypothetical protein